MKKINAAMGMALVSGFSSINEVHDEILDAFGALEIEFISSLVKL